MKRSSARPKRFNKSILLTRSHHFLLLAIMLFLISGTLGYFYIPITRTELVSDEMPFGTDYVDDSSLELGQEQIRSQGKNGTKEITYEVQRTLSGKLSRRKTVSEKTTTEPTPKTIARGTKRYQFMWCSNGYYFYYPNEQFKNPLVGYTHQSADDCAKNGKGHMTGLADTAPPQNVSTNYRSYAPIYTSPTTCRTQYNTYGGYFGPTATTTCY